MLSPLKKAFHARRNRSVVSFAAGSQSIISLKEGELAVITYTSAADKMKVFSSFIREGLENRDRVFYNYPDDESAVVRKRLVQNGIDPDKGEKSEKSGGLILRGASEHYLTNGKLNGKDIAKKELELRVEAKKDGYRHFRDLTDVGTFSFLKGNWQAFIEYLNDPDWGFSSRLGQDMFSDPFTMKLTAVNVENLSEESTRSILNALSGGKQSHTRRIDFLEYTDAFSRIINLSHEELLGRIILLEFDPASNYERVVEVVTKEALAHLEPVYVFTRHSSGIYESLARQPSVRIVLMSASASTLKPISENQIVLAADNSPLVLDSLREILSRHADRNILLIFDNISELVMSVGFEKAYKFMLYAVEMISSKPATALFLLNGSAHEAQEASRLRGLFQNILIYKGNSLEVLKSAPSS